MFLPHFVPTVAAGQNPPGLPPEVGGSFLHSEQGHGGASSHIPGTQGNDSGMTKAGGEWPCLLPRSKLMVAKGEEAPSPARESGRCTVSIPEHLAKDVDLRLADLCTLSLSPVPWPPSAFPSGLPLSSPWGQTFTASLSV